jgi:hypothetical protein
MWTQSEASVSRSDMNWFQSVCREIELVAHTAGREVNEGGALCSFGLAIKQSETGPLTKATIEVFAHALFAMRRCIIDAQCRRVPNGGAVRRYWKPYGAAGPLEELRQLERAVQLGSKSWLERALMCLSDEARAFMASAREVFSDVGSSRLGSKLRSGAICAPFMRQRLWSPGICRGRSPRREQVRENTLLRLVRRLWKSLVRSIAQFPVAK